MIACKASRMLQGRCIYCASVVLIPIFSAILMLCDLPIAAQVQPNKIDTMVVKDPLKLLEELRCCITDTIHRRVQIVESNSIPGWGTKDTLCVLDGVPLRYSQVRKLGLDSAKIKSKIWLEAADAMVIYGSRGMNGTYIIVTQKRIKAKASGNP